ncbi:unnamed protein product [marine sediment metagenome]|uniref:Uncharacterized protein n=1 Tax=marine sediment metagenome TaxID=412755 RepID=X0YIG8_9ZZZZ
MKTIMSSFVLSFTKKAYLRESLPHGKFDKNNTRVTKLVKKIKEF